MTKSTRPTVRIHNIETSEIIDREMTDEEFAQHQQDQADAIAEKAAVKAAAAAKQAVLDKLGLSAEEVTALLG
jgi:hypothetical protein